MALPGKTGYIVLPASLGSAWVSSQLDVPEHLQRKVMPKPPQLANTKERLRMSELILVVILQSCSFGH